MNLLSILRSLISLNIHIIYSDFISQSSNYTVRDNPKSRTQGYIILIICVIICGVKYDIENAN